MIQKTSIVAILVAFFLTLACFTHASPIFGRDPGDVVYVDFNPKPCLGRITFTELPGDVVRMTGQMNIGFPDDTASYRFTVGDISETFDADQIFPPGTAPFQEDFEDVTIDDFINKTFTFFRNNVILCQNKTVLVE